MRRSTPECLANVCMQIITPTDPPWLKLTAFQLHSTQLVFKWIFHDCHTFYCTVLLSRALHTYSMYMEYYLDTVAFLNSKPLQANGSSCVFRWCKFANPSRFTPCAVMDLHNDIQQLTKAAVCSVSEWLGGKKNSSKRTWKQRNLHVSWAAASSPLLSNCLQPDRF